MSFITSVLSFAFDHAGVIGAAVGIYTGGCYTPRMYSAVKAWVKSKL